MYPIADAVRMLCTCNTGNLQLMVANSDTNLGGDQLALENKRSVGIRRSYVSGSDPRFRLVDITLSKCSLSVQGFASPIKITETPRLIRHHKTST